MTIPVLSWIREHRLVLLISAAGAALRLYDLSIGDALSDEVLYGFRAIGMLDFDFAVSQPSTLQLFADRGMDIPWWTILSFHDHPVLVFLMQHWSMLLFGDTLIGMRLPSALFGIGAVLLVAVLGERLFSKRAGTIAAVFAAVNVLMLYVSRTGVQEAQVIFFSLLTVYCFIRARASARWWYACGASFGLALLSKYTAGYLAIPLLAELVVFDRRAFRSLHLYAAATLAVAVFSPALIYNLLLYRTFGHFDFQLSYMIGQSVSYWHVTPGKEIGSLINRVRGIPLNLIRYNSNVFNLLAVASFFSLIIAKFYRKGDTRQRQGQALLLFLIVFTLVLYLAIGPSPRFLTLSIPWFALAVGWAIHAVYARSSNILRSLLVVIFALVVAWESFFGINSYVLARPLGLEGVSYSAIHWDMHPWGYQELDRWFSRVTEDAYPSRIIPYRLGFLEEVRSRALERARSAGEKPRALLFIYSDNMSDLASLWTLNRHALYEAWPIITVQGYREALAAEGEDLYRAAGFSEIYFIQNTDAVLLNHSERISTEPDELEEKLVVQGVTPEVLRNAEGEEIFRIYRIP